MNFQYFYIEIVKKKKHNCLKKVNCRYVEYEVRGYSERRSKRRRGKLILIECTPTGNNNNECLHSLFTFYGRLQNIYNKAELI